MYDELLFKIGNVVRIPDMDLSAGRKLSYTTDLRIVGAAVMRELALLDEFITHFTTGMHQLPLDYRQNGFLRLFSRLGINDSLCQPNYLGNFDLRPRMHKALQAL